MDKTTITVPIPEPVGAEVIRHIGEDGWTYIKTVVDIVREPILILDKNFCVMAANEPFYAIFQVEAKDTEHRLVYSLGNGQWDIPALKKLLEEILPKNSFFKGFEVTHDFPIIGRKTMILNARQIHFKEGAGAPVMPPIILLAMEDVTDMMLIAEALAETTNKQRSAASKQAQKLETRMESLEKELSKLKKKPRGV
ncbi:MAG: hypothetical protein RLZZ283_380 [Candidatus Parcubacteria bacterium]|jgi:chemotaxis protein methyltransferase CheR